MANPASLRTGARIIEKAGHPISANQMRSAADEIERLQSKVDEFADALREEIDKKIDMQFESTSEQNDG